MSETTLFARQSTTSGSSTTSCPNSLSGGAVAGIVIGSIAGTLLIIWLLKSCFLPGAPGNPDPEKSMSEVVYSTRSGPRRQRRPRNYRSGGGTEYVEYIEQSPVRLSRSRTRRGSVTSVSRPERVYISLSE